MLSTVFKRSRSTTSSGGSSSAVVPKLAILLGGGGLIPFFWYGLQHRSFKAKEGKGKPWGDEVLAKWEKHLSLPLSYFSCVDQATVRYRFTSYSASILSFMGAVHWGSAMCSPSPFGALQYTVSVLPSLLAWGAMNMSETAGGSTEGTARHSVLALGHLMIYFFDEALGAKKPLPPIPTWYSYLRSPLTCIVVGTHVAAAVLSKDPSITDK